MKPVKQTPAQMWQPMHLAQAFGRSVSKSRVPETCIYGLTREHGLDWL
jgi:hypothetical protein